jgi:hypothetical protein
MGSNRLFQLPWFVPQDVGFRRAPVQINDLQKKQLDAYVRAGGGVGPGRGFELKTAEVADAAPQLSHRPAIKHYVI